MHRLQTGIPDLDEMLGGGLIPGTLTVVCGATGIGKTQLGLQWNYQGKKQEGETGILFDLTTRGDSQNHREYAQRLFDWTPTEQHPDTPLELSHLWDRALSRRDYLHIFQQSGRRVTRNEMDVDGWREWKVELARKLDAAIYFFYANFVHGSRRVIIDGVEPTEKECDSFQFHLFEYVYHQILHKESDWVARDLFRVNFRANEPTIMEHSYRHQDVGCLLLYTTHEQMLDDMLERPIQSGDVLANANTIILMGKTREAGKMGRALHISKHRGSACDESIVPYDITASGLKLRR